MTDEASRWDRVKQVFQAALDRPPEERARFLRESCMNDRALLREVQSLLEAHGQAGDFGERPAIDLFVSRSPDVAMSSDDLLVDYVLKPGARLGPYEIAGPIGLGGMGEVYRATDTKLKRQVALKVLSEVLATDPERLARFQREAQILASLNHPNIAQVYGLEEAGGVKALVMELVEGPTLAELIARGPIPLDESLRIARQIAEALEAAHDHHITHRDLKPANVKVRFDGEVKVLDFGLAKAMEPSLFSPVITPATTRVGQVLGTPAYMSPEQARGKLVDKRADLWAFGCIVYEMLTGRRAFEAEDVSLTLAEVMKSEPDFSALPDGTPPGVRQALRLCLQKNPRERGGDIAAIRLVLEGAFESSPNEKSGVSVTPLTRRSVIVILGALAAGILVTMFTASRFWPAASPATVQRFNQRLSGNETLRNLGWSPLAVSADGQSYVYNTSAGLYVRTMEDLRPRLVPGTEEDLAFPFFSPDGQSIAYFTYGTGNQTLLKRIALRGGAPVLIADVPTPNPYGASWELDGSIYFGQTAGIMRVPASGGTPTLVIAADKGTTFYGPQLLPDGDSVMFTVSAGESVGRWDEAQIVVQSLSSGKRTVVVKGGSDARYLRTGHLVYAFGDTLLGVPFDVDRLAAAGEGVPLEQGVMRALNGLSGSANYGISERGTLVYIRAVAPIPSSLVWVDRRGRETPFAGSIAGSPEYPRLSPNGTQLALTVAGDVWVYDLAGRPPIKLTSDRGNYSPLWTHDGTRLIYEGTSPVGLLGILADGSQTKPQPVLVVPEWHYHAHGWSRDSDELLVVAFGETTDIMKLRSGSSGVLDPVVQTPAKEGAEGASLSPDGRWLAYVSNQTGRQEIWVQPYGRTGRPVRVSPNGGVEPVWARNSRELFYLEGTRLMGATVSPDATFKFNAPRLLFESPYRKMVQPPSYDVAPDGRFLMIKADDSARDSTTEIVIVQNWHEHVQRLVPSD